MSVPSLKALTSSEMDKEHIFCALIYRPPQASADFIKGFAECLSVIRVKYDKAHVPGNFNIHVYCPSVSCFTAKVHLSPSVILTLKNM